LRFLVLFATTQGQTRKIAQHVADHLTARGQAVTLVQAQADRAPDLTGIDAAILAGSVHAGRYQTELVQTARTLAPGLSARPGLFLSVSLTAAGDDPGERAELDRLAQGFLADTGWQGAKIAQIAGALRFSDYGFFEYWGMRWIARQRGLKAEGRTDLELTDWQGLKALLEGFMAGAAARH